MVLLCMVSCVVMINNGHIGLHYLRNLKRKANEATNNPCGTAAGIGGSVCINHLCPVVAGGGVMTKDEALKLALEALDNLLYWDNGKSDYDQAREAITAIKQALALDKKAENARELGLDYEPVLKDNSNYRLDPPVAEPVVFYRCNGCGHAYEQVHPTSCDCMEAGGFDRVEYYTTPPASQRTWVGLTDDEILKLAYPIRWQEVDDFEADKAVNFAQMVEAKLKEKNNG
jgi:hypothetical protein